MSSVGQALGGIVGGAIGFFVGGPAGALKGAQIGIMAGGIIDPPPGPVINGPRLDDLSVQTSTYGAFIPRNYGTIAQTGNVFWIKGDALTETPVSTESGGKGGPTTTTNTWEYSATFAVGLCEGPIDGVRRIWIGNQLWYDAGSSDLVDILASNESSALFTLYLGTNTQNPDPLIQADRGIANTPAYRGLAYIVFDNLPLEKYSNSLLGAQVKCEIVKSGTVGGLVSHGVQSLTSGLGNYTNAPYQDASGVHVWQVDSAWASGTTASVRRYLIPPIGAPVFIGQFNATFPYRNLGGGHYIAQGHSDKNIFVVPDFSPGAGGISLLWPDGNQIDIKSADGGDPIATECAYVITGDYVFFTCGADSTFNITRARLSGADRVEVPLPWPVFNGAYYCGMIAGELVVGLIRASDSKPYFVTFDPISLACTGQIDIIAEYGSSTVLSYSDCDGDNLFYISAGSNLYRRNGLLGADILFGNLGTLPNWVPSSYFMPWSVFYKSDSLFSIWYSNYSGTMSLGTWSSARIVPDMVSLSSIVQSECLTSKLLTVGDLDVTELTDSVRGYRVTQQGAIRGAIDPLRAAFPFDVVQHGYQIKFKRRGSASVATIDASELDARSSGSDPGVQITNSRDMDTLLPRLMTLKYIDADREYDVNEQPAQRGA